MDARIEYQQVRRRIQSYETYMRTKLFGPHDAFVVLPNAYPYLPFHYVFWVHPKYKKYYSFTRIKSMIYTLYPHATNLFENPQIRKSIFGIRHVHFQLIPVVGRYPKIKSLV